MRKHIIRECELRLGAAGFIKGRGACVVIEEKIVYAGCACFGGAASLRTVGQGARRVSKNLQIHKSQQSKRI